jgi:hypothetical protein
MSYKIHSLEFQLAISCSAIDKTLAGAIINQLKAKKDFKETDFLIFLRRHQICELAFTTLEANPFFSNSFHLQLELQAKANQLKAISGQALQVKLQNYFHKNNVYAIFLKGLLLSKQYYGDIGARNFLDIDVWVEDKNYENVRSYIKSLGYVGLLDKHDFNLIQLKYYRNTTHDEIFYNESNYNAPVVELHWKLRNALGNFKFNTNVDKLHLLSYEMNGQHFSIFNDTDQFIFLAVHGAEHAWFKLKWLVDLYHLVKRTELDWSSVVARAKQLDSLIEVKLAWTLLEQLYGLMTPMSIKQIRLSFLNRLRLNYVSSQLVYEGQFCDTYNEKLRNVLYTISLNRKMFLPKELVLKNLTNTTDWLTLPLPQYLFFLYFPLRPFLWIYRKFKRI